MEPLVAIEVLGSDIEKEKRAFFVPAHKDRPGKSAETLGLDG
jgi:hypothetical protein